MIRVKYGTLEGTVHHLKRGPLVLTGLLGQVLQMGPMVGGFTLILMQNEEEEGMKERSQQDVLGIVEDKLIKLSKCGGHRLWQCHVSAEQFFTYKLVMVSFFPP